MRSKAFLFFNAIWAFSLLYYCTGKWNWNIPSYFMLILYVVFCIATLNLGYWTSQKATLEPRSIQSWEQSKAEVFHRYRHIFGLLCLTTMFFQVMWVVTFLGEFSITNVLETLGENYYERMEATFDSPVLVMRLRNLFYIVTYFVFPMGFMFFKQMPLRYKLLFVLTVVVETLASLNMGVSKNIGDLVIIGIAVLILNAAGGGETMDPAARKRRKKLLGRVVLTVGLFLVAFAIIQNFRAAVSYTRENPYGEFATYREGSLFALLFGENSGLTKLLNRMGVYLSHGYTGLAYALGLPYENTYGLGFSTALMDYAHRYFGLPELTPATYNYRLEMLYGWKNGQWWATAFVRFANAVTLWGVPVVTFFLGKFFASVERRWYEERTFLSLIWVCQLSIAFVYLSCNAQIVQGRQALIATAILAVAYVIHDVFKVRFVLRK